MDTEKKGGMAFWAAASACVVAILLGVLFFSSPRMAGIRDATAAAFNGGISGAGSMVEVKRDAPPGMREYRSAQYHFSLFYPEELSVSERAEGGGAMTITFQNIEKAEGFQIFIVPYTNSQVTEDRFKKDEPSGVRTGAKDIKIDGVTASSFFSKDAILGETSEIWFIRNGYLYEVTTLKPLQSLLEQVMTTWEFIDAPPAI